MISKFIIHKNEAIKLREKGLTYGEIRESLNVKIPKSTLSVWFKGLRISPSSQKRLGNAITVKLKQSLEAALVAKKKKRKEYWKKLESRISHFAGYLKGENNIDIAKIILAVLYLGEGKKGAGRAFMLGNSDPKIVMLFLGLLRKCYPVDESKFRCTLQCRSDQDILSLEKFWSHVTAIPLRQFYKARIDPRTIGKKSKKPEYKGVCRIDYFSADIYNEVEKIIEIICNMGH